MLKTSTRCRQFVSDNVIHRHLNAYLRQYFGIINDKEQKLVHINFHWNRLSLIDVIDVIDGNSGSRLKFKSDYSLVFDGYSYYWQINVNLDEKELSDLWVNGVG